MVLCMLSWTLYGHFDIWTHDGHVYDFGPKMVLCMLSWTLHGLDDIGFSWTQYGIQIALTD